MLIQGFLPTLQLYGLDESTLLVIGLLGCLAAILLLWRRLRGVEFRLEQLSREVNALNLIEERRYLLSLNSPQAKIDGTQPSNTSIVPETADNISKVHCHS